MRVAATAFNPVDAAIRAGFLRDAFPLSFPHVPGFDVDILLLPIGAPWLKLSETVDYLRAVTPRTAVLVHGAGLAAPHRALARTLITKLAPAGTTVLDPATGEALTA